MGAGARGVLVETLRGYQIFKWTGEDIDNGKCLPFTTSPVGSFDWTRHATLEEARASIAAAPSLRKISVTFDAYLPNVGATDDQIYEWLRFELHANGSIGPNPLIDHALEAIDVDFDVTVVK